jgi:hypothetical protein
MFFIMARKLQAPGVRLAIRDANDRREAAL